MAVDHWSDDGQTREDCPGRNLIELATLHLRLHHPMMMVQSDLKISPGPDNGQTRIHGDLSKA